MARYIVDASVAVKWLVSERHSEEAINYLIAASKGETELLAPAMMRVETVNALRTYVRRNKITSEEALRGVEALQGLPVYYLDDDWNLLQDALRVSMESEIAVYDAVYLAHAAREGIPLLTADEKLADKLKGEHPVVMV